MKTLHPLLVILLAMQLSGLKAEVTETLGQSEVSIGGDVEERFSGSAMYMTVELESGNRMLVNLYRYESDVDLTAVSLMFNDSRVTPGTYAIIENTTENDVVTAVLKMSDGVTFIGSPVAGDPMMEDGTIDLNHNVQAGELVIESVGGDVITGSFRFNGEMVKMKDIENVMEFTLEARFKAVAGEASDLPGLLGQPAMSQ